MKKFNIANLGIIILLFMVISGCSMHTVITYNGDRLPSDQIAKVELSDNLSEINENFNLWNFSVDLLAVDNIEMNKDGATWSRNHGPASIELLPGNHTLIIEQFLKPRAQGFKTLSSMTARMTYWDPGRKRETIINGPVTLNAEAGHNYSLTILNGQRFRFMNDSILRYIIEDKTADGKIVSSNIPQQKLDFSLQNIPKDKAVVCIYRERKMGGCMGDFVIVENRQDIGILPNGYLLYFVTTPGNHNYNIFLGRGINANLNVDLAPAVITYVSVTSVPFAKEICSLVPESEALVKIKELRPVTSTGMPDQNRCL
jgi:hypothetical protein